MTYDLPLYINKGTWKLVSVDSQHSGNEATKAFDNNTSTFWHTEYQGSEPTCPHTIIIDMVKDYEVTAVTYLARQDGNANGMVKEYEIYLSSDGKTWGTAVATGEFKNTTALQAAKLKTAKTARYLKFVAKSEINGRAWTSAAEIGIEANSEVDPTGVDGASHLNDKGEMINDKRGGVYDLQGRRVGSAEANSSLFTLHSSLKRGLYISGGRKLLK